MDTTLDGLDSTNVFLDDIIVITKGTIEKHEKEIDKTLNRLNEENLAISLHRCEFGLNEITWLGYKINAEGIKPTKRKTDAIIQLDNPKTPKQLRSFIGSIHHLIKFIPKLAKLSAPIRPLLSSSTSKKTGMERKTFSRIPKHKKCNQKHNRTKTLQHKQRNASQMQR